MNAKNLHTLGIDIGSTTVKIAILNDENEVLFSDYERHFANIQETAITSWTNGTPRCLASVRPPLPVMTGETWIGPSL